MRNSRGFAITKISLKNNVHSSSMIMNLINDLIVQQTIISISRHRAGTEPAQFYAHICRLFAAWSLASLSTSWQPIWPVPGKYCYESVESARYLFGPIRTCQTRSVSLWWSIIYSYCANTISSYVTNARFIFNARFFAVYHQIICAAMANIYFTALRPAAIAIVAPAEC